MISLQKHIKEIDEGENDPPIFKTKFPFRDLGLKNFFCWGKLGLLLFGFVGKNLYCFERLKECLGKEPDNIFQ
ncbi:MAG: hypothetical protein CM15mV16_0850 [uncultured marine virus]|nr:MAG: hypothetical protein CM15mV16_0850 [uncultured marine virus]